MIVRKKKGRPFFSHLSLFLTPYFAGCKEKRKRKGRNRGPFLHSFSFLSISFLDLEEGP